MASSYTKGRTVEAGWEDELGKKMAVVIKNLMDKAERTHFWGAGICQS